MKAEFETIKAAWDAEDRDMEYVRELSDAYVAQFPDEFTSFEGLDEVALVKALEVFREAGLEDDEFRVQVWIWHHFEPQEIGGTYRAKVRTH